MTRKDYIGLAEALRAAMPQAKYFEPGATLQGISFVAQWHADCYAVAGYLGAWSSAFDRALFLQNCGVQS